MADEVIYSARFIIDPAMRDWCIREVRAMSGVSVSNMDDGLIATIADKFKTPEHGPDRLDNVRNVVRGLSPSYREIAP